MRGRRKEPLSRVYLDDYPITLMGDESTPPLSRIIRAGGKWPDRVDVVYLTSPADKRGRRVDAEEIIDRTAEPTRPIYLRTVPKPVSPEVEKPVATADRPAPLTRPDPPSFLTSRDPMPNVDPVISQLGGRRPDDTKRRQGILPRLRATAFERAARLARAKAPATTAEAQQKRPTAVEGDDERDGGERPRSP